MQLIPDMIGPVFFGLACAIALFAGFVKGAVGFGMPMIMISGMASFLSPELALAALILPTVMSNLWQALRAGLRAALIAISNHRVFITALLFFIVISAQLINSLSATAIFLFLGVMVSAFGLAQLFGFRFSIQPAQKRRAELMLGSLAGFVGGLSGVWGPPTVAYLTALNTPKAESVRIQGVIYGAGSVALLLSHINTGILNAKTLPLALWMIPPALIGMAIGLMVQDRLDQDKFRRATLFVLVIAGLNLIRRGIWV